MKELSIKEKAERYDELLKKLQEAKEDNDVRDERYCCVIDDIVPELKDSEEREANNFAIGRVICRYHHNSDTIIGRVIGAMISACIRATSDYDNRIKEIEV